MRIMAVIFPEPIKRDDISNMCDGLNGYWVESTDEFVVEAEEAVIYVSVSDDFSDYEAHELSEIDKKLGVPPASIVLIQMGSASNSKSLAYTLAEQWVKEHRAVIDAG